MKTTKIFDHELNDEYLFISAEHFGYNNMNIKHNRKIFVYNNEFVIIIDKISGDGQHKIRRNFNIGRSEIQQMDDSGILLELGSKKVNLKYLDKPKIKIEKGRLDPIAGWASNKYGEKFPSSVIFDERSTKLPLLLGTIIYLEGKSELNYLVNKFEIDNQSFFIQRGSSEFNISFENNLKFSQKGELKNV